MNLSASRRGFLLGGAATAAASMLPRFASAAKPSPVRLGIASYTFRKFDQEKLIQFMHELKTPYLNLKDTHLPMTPLVDVPKRAAEYRAAGLQLTGAGAIYFRKDTDEDVRPAFEYLKAAGIRMFVGAPSHECLPRVEKFVKEYDIRMGLHNHGPEDKEFPSPNDVHKAIDKMDHRIGYCIDLGHTLRTDTDPVEAIRMAGDRLFDIHMKDLADPHKKESQVAVGEGVMPVRKIFETLIDIHYKGIVDLEYEIKADDPMPGVTKSFAFMRDVLKQMGYSA